jgi:hypothetical protein
MLARREQLDPRPLGEGLHPEVGEPLVREAQLYAGVRASALTPQPFAVQEVGTREIYCDTGPTEPVDRLEVQVLRRRPLGEERFRA